MRNEDRTKKVTLQDLADRLGCSANTVSLALRNSPRISQQVRDRIRRLAGKMNYTPNYAARNLRRRRSGLIGIYVAHALRDAVRVELVNRLLDELNTAEYRPVLGIGGQTPGANYHSPWMDTFRQLQVEALVIIGSFVDTLPDWCHGMPVVLLGCHPSASLDCDVLALDRAEAGRLAGQHLVDRRHRSVLVVCSPTTPFGAGAISVIESAGGKARSISDGDLISNFDNARKLGRRLVDTRGDATAVVMGDAPLAAALMRGFLDAGGAVPDDLAMVAYDYFPWADMLAVPLTTVEQPIARMAPAAVDLIKKRLDHPDSPPMHLEQNHELVVRRSS